ncbi:hypothetical protein EIK76_03045 [Rheinheimera mesophila]|uniref:Uncharacterized protein n=1 Tax=Rheinheimera mesophila TaxID=1547515 RepID=A0A3P3QRK3_9GAMM|nr:hypothetical protein [Rheinheimera mesophila]KKL02221.1 hypothetical protein SD53_05760 [Rheinheimera mesophila]RRJ23080.1 hypothetical protein EIK76_03045 [Rheinheimera mesophila]
MIVYLYLEVDLSDDDADLEDVARDCGHTLSHPQLLDWDLLGVTNWHGHACLEFQLQMKATVAESDLHQLISDIQVQISHPAVSSSRTMLVSDTRES